MLIRIFFVFLFCFSTNHLLADSQKVYIYGGPGVSEKSLKQTQSTFEKLLKPNYEIEVILPLQLINDDWESKTALLIIPGGADIPYTKALNGLGNQKIRSFVEKGGAFIGICAGSYYAGSFVDFAQGTAIEVQGERELSFFPGVVRGPILAPYDYKTSSSARAAKIIWNDEFGFKKDDSFVVFYNGGGYFVDASGKPLTTVLASYDLGKEFPAVIECRVGSGKVILSGVHFEYDPNLLDPNDSYLKQIIPSLNEGTSRRMQLLKHLLQRLNIKVNES